MRLTSEQVRSLPIGSILSWASARGTIVIGEVAHLPGRIPVIKFPKYSLTEWPYYSQNYDNLNKFWSLNSSHEFLIYEPVI